MIRYMTAGESHGKSVSAIIDGIPAGLKITPGYIDRQLARRQAGYGRGGRMDIEKDTVEITAGIRWGETIGSPVCLSVKNRDWDNCRDIMDISGTSRDREKYLTKPRPGHADLAGALKYNREDMRDILERASARETAARVAAGALARKLLEEFGVTVLSYTCRIGDISADIKDTDALDPETVDSSPLRCPDSGAEAGMMKLIDRASEDGDTLGGVFTIVIRGVPVGLGSHTQWDMKLDARLAFALMSIQAIKGVGAGAGFGAAAMPGSEMHDTILYDPERSIFRRNSNNSGGFEGGITNGEDIILSAAMKPINSLRKPLESVDMKSKEKVLSEIVRSDVCAVPAAGIVGEAATALEVARALKEKFGGDSVGEMKRNYESYLEQLRNF